MSITAGEVLGIKAPIAGQTVRLPVTLIDVDGAVVTGIAWDAAGMTVAYCKEGQSSFTAFPLFATTNWDEIGYGLYVVVLDGGEADEAALLDTEGHLIIYVKSDATRGDTFLFKVNPADVAREDQWTDAKAAYLDAAVTSRAAPGAQMDLVNVPNGTALTAIGMAVWATTVRTLSSFGTLVADIWAYATRTLTAWLGGAKLCTFTVQDALAAPIGACPYTLRNVGGQVLQSGNSHAATGQFTANLDEANDYSVTLGPMGGYSFSNPYDVDVGAGPTQSFTLTGTKITEPAAPISVTNATIWSDEYDPDGAGLVGSAARTAYVSSVDKGKWSAALNSHFMALSEQGTGAATSANGRWQMVVPCNLLLTIKIVDNTTEDVEYWQVTIPSATGAYSIWDLHPKSRTLEL